MTRVVFLGTPEFAVPALLTLIEAPDFQVVGVVTQPDRPAGRGQKLREPAVKQAAATHSIPVYQPATLRDEAAVAQLQSWQPAVIVVAAFGQILRQPVLELPPHGCINIHASLLPRWRGAAPIQYAIRAGDAATGVTIMQMDAGLDSGPIIAQQAIPIRPDETGATLHDRLAALGAEALIPALRGYLAGEITPQAQPLEGVTLAPTIKKEAGQIDWSEPAAAIDRQVRAYDPWPGTYTFLEGVQIKITRGHPLPGELAADPPGTLLNSGGLPGAATGDGIYLIEELQPAGKPRMASSAFLAGRQDAPGKCFAPVERKAGREL